MNEAERERANIIETMCHHFRLDPQKISHIEEVEMLYVFRYVRQMLADDSLDRIIAEIAHMQSAYRIRSKRRKLYLMFFRCQNAVMTASGRYDTKTLKAPVSAVRGNYY